MEKPEIVAGLRTAIERGYTLEFAKQSFLNAGYSRQDVEDSARAIDSGISSFNQQPQQEGQPQHSPYDQTQQIKQTIQRQPQTTMKPLSQQPKEQTQLQQTQQPQSTQTKQAQEDQKQQTIQAQQPSQQYARLPELWKKPQQPAQQLQAQQGYQYKKPKNSEKKSKSWIAVVIILGIILLVLIGGLLITLFKKDWILSFFESIGLL